MCSDVYNKLPLINSTYLSFIKVFHLTEFEWFSNLNQENSLYSKYYKLYEKNSDIQNSELKFITIPELGTLMPLKHRRTKNNFWKYFRKKEIFQFLPLKLKISVKKAKINKVEYPIKLFIYIFPFGVFTINLEIKISNLPINFTQLINLINYIPNGVTISFNTLSINPCNFTNFVKYTSKIINNFFCNVNLELRSDFTHNIIFIRDTNERLYFDTNSTSPELIDHIKGLAGLLSNDHFIMSKHDDYIKNLISCKLSERNKEELFLFSSKRSLIYPSISWINEFKKSKSNESNKTDPSTQVKNDFLYEFSNDQVERSCRCMNKNYQSCLNFLFSLQSYIRNNHSINKKLSIQNIIKDNLEDHKNYYYKHAIKPIGIKLGIFDERNE